MSIERLARSLRHHEITQAYLSQRERFEATQMLLNTANRCVLRLRDDLQESEATTNRRKAKRRETEVDPKPPVKPVRVAEPNKPKKPKYSGNHAPSAPRR